MRGKDFNTGLRGVLFEARHYDRMGSAIWLYGWLVLRQTHQTGSTGWVLGGAPISYKEIEEETGFNARTLERWMRTLRRGGYVETEAAMGGLIVRITKAKKHGHAARSFAGAAAPETFRRAAEGIRRPADDPRSFAEGYTQNCGAERRQVSGNTRFPAPIRSSSIEESVEQHQPQNEIQTLTPSCPGERQNPAGNRVADNLRDPFSEPGRAPRIRVQAPQSPWLALAETRLQLELLRAEREEAVRRELHVGRSPEIAPPKQAAPAEPEVKRP
jgi:hypothetical protein